MEITQYGQFRDGGSELVEFSNGLRVYRNFRSGSPDRGKVYEDKDSGRQEITDPNLIWSIDRAIREYRDKL